MPDADRWRGRWPRRPQPGQLTAWALRLGEHLPWPVVRPVARLAGLVLARRPNRALRQWALNVTALTGRAPSRRLVADAVVSWARNSVESVRLGRLTPQQIRDRVGFTPGSRERLERIFARDGAVIALPHSGSWDLAGAWACLHRMPVTTVAEELLAPEFAYFLAARQRLGFTVHGHRGATVARHLVADARAGKLVCLMADRNFSRGGVPVRWPSPTGELAALMPPGPAHVALQSGAVLLGLTCHYEGSRMMITVSEPIAWSTEGPDGGPADPDQQVRTMMQQVCEFFAEQLSAHPADWHMMRPVFTGVRA